MGEERVTSFAAMPVAPDLIPSLHQPVQQVLWIGCADSGFHETTILDLLRDEMMVHRNLGNMIVDGDLSCETAVKYAVSVLQVRHIIVCGHYGCGLVKASSREGLTGPWLNKLDSLHATHKHNIDQLPTTDRDRAFVELNVLEQLRSLRSFAEVASATESGALQLHGLVYDARAGTASRLLEAH
ncbi:carbonic anhydrase [Penicillium hispanicum]|uniref:carbonic anhydrase n=1 Tax=Penicillium hispanicum TaxID=1080232 RepID=UPI0025424C21|nr:carbonic anhydrase [Penicillium hispanicum]KAJ5580262.1 carbonic anhydrase [Penicillium hispanicum]